MNAARARLKLAEARFFLGHLAERDDGLFERDPQAFSFYLSAFLNAGYSVTQMTEVELTRHLRKRGQKGTGGSIWASFVKEWASSLSESDREIWEFMPPQRGAEVHREGVELHADKKLVPVKPRIDYERSGWGRYRYHPTYYMQAMSVSPALLGIPPEEWIPASVWREALVHEFKIGAERRKVAEVCGQYCGLLEQLIVAVELNFLAVQRSPVPDADGRWRLIVVVPSPAILALPPTRREMSALFHQGRRSRHRNRPASQHD